MRAAPSRVEITGRRRVSVPANSRDLEKHGVRRARSRGPPLICAFARTICTKGQERTASKGGGQRVSISSISIPSGSRMKAIMEPPSLTR